MKMMHSITVKQAAMKERLQELALEAIYKKHGLLPKSYFKSSQQIEGASKAANQVKRESKEKLELDS